jgi:hypothetical protein
MNENEKIIYVVHSDVNENNILQDFEDLAAALEYAKDNIDEQTYIEEVVCDEDEETIYSTEVIWSYDEDDAENQIVCEWCGDLVYESECRRELNLGLICKNCQSALYSRGEKPVFEEAYITDNAECNDIFAQEFEDAPIVSKYNLEEKPNLDELFDVSLNAKLDGGDSNNVSVLGSRKPKQEAKENLDEFFDIDLDLGLDGGTGNDVSVLSPLGGFGGLGKKLEDDLDVNHQELDRETDEDEHTLLTESLSLPTMTVAEIKSKLEKGDMLDFDEEAMTLSDEDGFRSSDCIVFYQVDEKTYAAERIWIDDKGEVIEYDNPDEEFESLEELLYALDGVYVEITDLDKYIGSELAEALADAKDAQSEDKAVADKQPEDNADQTTQNNSEETDTVEPQENITVDSSVLTEGSSSKKIPTYTLKELEDEIERDSLTIDTGEERSNIIGLSGTEIRVVGSSDCGYHIYEILYDTDGEEYEGADIEDFDDIVILASYLVDEGYIEVTDLDQYLDELEECVSKETKLSEDTHAQYAKPEGDKVASYNNALKYAKKNNADYIYGYTNHSGKFFALEQPIKMSEKIGETEKEFRNKYKNCSTVYVAYRDKNFVEELEEEAVLDEAIGEVAGTLALAAGGGLLAGAANAISKRATEKALDAAESKMASNQQSQETELSEQVGSNFVGQNLDPRDPNVVLINHYYPTLCKREDVEAVTEALDYAVDLFVKEEIDGLDEIEEEAIKKSDKLLDMNFYGLGGYLNGICEEAGLSYGDIIPVDLFVDGILEAYEEDDLTITDYKLGIALYGSKFERLIRPYNIDRNMLQESISLKESQSQEISREYRRLSKEYGIDFEDLVYGEKGFMQTKYPNNFPDFAGDVIYSEKYWNELVEFAKEKGINLK